MNGETSPSLATSNTIVLYSVLALITNTLLCLFVLGIRDDFIPLSVPSIWAGTSMQQETFRHQALVSGQEAEEESNHLYYALSSLSVCTPVREPV